MRTQGLRRLRRYFHSNITAVGKISLTWSLREHLAIFTRGSKTSSVVGTDLNEVVGVWQHVLQPGLIDCGRNKYAICSRLWVNIFSPILHLVSKKHDIYIVRLYKLK